MSRIFEVDPERLGQTAEALDAATEALRAANLVVLPTDTVYGIAARPDLSGATSRLFEAKRRPQSLTLPILTPTEEDAWSVGEPTPAARALAGVFWPGPLTIVLERTDRSRPWWLGTAGETIGIRVPDHDLTRALLHRTGPLAVTSANVSGVAPLSAREDLMAAFGDLVEVYVVLQPDARPPGGAASTVVDCTGQDPRILRPGPIDEIAVLAATGR
jgi:L-threonylcarbamoyladenylate synthase